MPAGLAKLIDNQRINWDYHTAPEPLLHNRTLWWPRGKVLGAADLIRGRT